MRILIKGGMLVTAENTFSADILIDGGKISRVSYLPCLINAQKQPEVLKNDERGRQVFDFVDTITREASLNHQMHF